VEKLNIDLKIFWTKFLDLQSSSQKQKLFFMISRGFFDFYNYEKNL